MSIAKSDDLAKAGATQQSPAHRVQSAGNLFCVFFGESAHSAPVTNFAQAQASETWRYPAFFHSMLDAGVYLPPSAYESWFVSAALDDNAIDRIAAALPIAAKAAAAAVAP